MRRTKNASALLDGDTWRLTVATPHLHFRRRNRRRLARIWTMVGRRGSNGQPPWGNVSEAWMDGEANRRHHLVALLGTATQREAEPIGLVSHRGIGRWLVVGVILAAGVVTTSSQGVKD